MPEARLRCRWCRIRRAMQESASIWQSAAGISRRRLWGGGGGARSPRDGVGKQVVSTTPTGISFVAKTSMPPSASVPCRSCAYRSPSIFSVARVTHVGKLYFADLSVVRSFALSARKFGCVARVFMVKIGGTTCLLSLYAGPLRRNVRWHKMPAVTKGPPCIR